MNCNRIISVWLYLKMFGDRKPPQAVEGMTPKPLSKMTSEELHYMIASSCKEAGVDMNKLLEEVSRPSLDIPIRKNDLADPPPRMV